MKGSSKYFIVYGVVALALVPLLSIIFLASNYCMEELENTFSQAKERSMQELLSLQKNQTREKVEKLRELFKKENKKVEPLVKKRLKQKVSIMKSIVEKIYKRDRKKVAKKKLQQRIKERVLEMSSEEFGASVFIRDFQSNVVLGETALGDKEVALYSDADNRTIVLEEIQKVRRYGEGFLKSRRATDKDYELIYVEDLEVYGWYIGISMKIKTAQKQLKSELIEHLEYLPISDSEFLSLYEDEKLIYQSKNRGAIKAIVEDGWHKLSKERVYLFSETFSEFNWRIVYGFANTMPDTLVSENERLKEELKSHLAFIVKLTWFIALVTFVLSLLLFYKLKRVFRNYELEIERLQRVKPSLEVCMREEIRIYENDS